MNTQIRLSHVLSRCLLACSVLVLLSAPAGYAKTASTSKDHAKTNKASKTKETKETSKAKENSETVSVLKDGANVRTGPDAKDPVAMELFQGYPLKVVEKKGDWLKVSDFDNDSGWISKKMVGPGKTVIVSAKDTINMRSEPKESGTIIANIEHGVVLTKISTKGDWVQVKHTKGTEGWINKKLLWP
ncbi:MAG: SH3 domain-containing protein [Deltaproteobacteria bacterium]|nr:SH3 domain-containing protein [Deltaproteobacteria bacterium]